MPLQQYKPDPPPDLSDESDAQKVLAYLMLQLERIASLGGGLGGDLVSLTAEPKKKSEFMIVAADGLHWDPGFGKGIYSWFAGQWNPMFVAEENPTEEPEEPEEPLPEPPPPENPDDPAGYFFFASWEEGDKMGAKRADGSYDPNYFAGNHSAAADRIQVQDKSVLPGGVGTDGSKILMFQTRDGDLIKSSSWYRAELSLGQTKSDGFVNRNQWWAYSLYIPADYSFPENRFNASLHGQFHSVRSTGQPHWTMEIALESEGGQDVAMWRQRINAQGGELGPRTYPRGRVEVERGHWYDFTMNIKWTHDNTGFFKTWMRRRDEAEQALVQDRAGFVSLYDGYGVYFKIGNYHSPISGGVRTYYDRLLLGYDAASVAISPLEGVVL